MNYSLRPPKALQFQKPKILMPPPPPPRRDKAAAAAPRVDPVGLYFEHLSPNVDEDLLARYIDSAGFEAISLQVTAMDSFEKCALALFQDRATALEVCYVLNGCIIDEIPVRIRKDRGEFVALMKHRRAADEAASSRDASSSTAKQDSS